MGHGPKSNKLHYLAVQMTILVYDQPNRSAQPSIPPG